MEGVVLLEVEERDSVQVMVEGEENTSPKVKEEAPKE